MRQNINLFNFERGDEVTADAVNEIILDAYQKINSLTYENVGTISTGQIIGKNLFSLMLFPNFCGKMDSRSTVASYYNLSLAKTWIKANEVLEILGG